MENIENRWDNSWPRNGGGGTEGGVCIRLHNRLVAFFMRTMTEAHVTRFLIRNLGRVPCPAYHNQLPAQYLRTATLKKRSMTGAAAKTSSPWSRNSPPLPIPHSWSSRKTALARFSNEGNTSNVYYCLPMSWRRRSAIQRISIYKYAAGLNKPSFGAE